MHTPPLLLHGNEVDAFTTHLGLTTSKEGSASWAHLQISCTRLITSREKNSRHGTTANTSTGHQSPRETKGSIACPPTYISNCSDTRCVVYICTRDRIRNDTKLCSNRFANSISNNVETCCHEMPSLEVPVLWLVPWYVPLLDWL